MKNVETLLHIGLFAANRALLTFYAPNVDGDPVKRAAIWRGRTIRSSPGQSVQKPVVSTVALIVLSILLGLQMLGLAYLAYYICHVPTWTGALDALAMARIGQSVAHQGVLPPIGPVTRKDIDALRDVDGLVGIVATEDEPEGSHTRLTPNNASGTDVSEMELQPLGNKGAYMKVEEQTPLIQLGLGAPGVIRSGRGIDPTRWRKKADIEF